MNWYMFVPHGRRINEGILVLAADQCEAEKCMDGFNVAQRGPFAFFLVENSAIYSSSFIYLKHYQPKKSKNLSLSFSSPCAESPTGSPKGA